MVIRQFRGFILHQLLSISSSSVVVSIIVSHAGRVVMQIKCNSQLWHELQINSNVSKIYTSRVDRMQRRWKRKPVLTILQKYKKKVIIKLKRSIISLDSIIIVCWNASVQSLSSRCCCWCCCCWFILAQQASSHCTEKRKSSYDGLESSRVIWEWTEAQQ